VEPTIYNPFTDQRLKWYLNAKFGLFIHWGPYSAAGVEASWPIMAPELSATMFGTQTRITETEYQELPASFNPVDFNADAWVAVAKEAGMRYIVFTAKHHDGFCMFDAPGTEYKITNTPYGRDICMQLAHACAKTRMPLGFYYSPPDMHHPEYRNTSYSATKNWMGEPKRKGWAEYLDYMESHIRKLLSDYGEVSILWFDGLTNHGKYDPPRFHKLIHELSPNTLINDRLGAGFDFITPEQFIPRDGIPTRTGKPPTGIDPGGDGFFKLVTLLIKIPILRGWILKQVQKYADGTMELTPVHQEPYPSLERFQLWETCMTMGQSWGYNPEETRWKDPATLLSNLVEVISRGGNYLLNVGPNPKGIFPEEATERLQHIGRWMDRYHESIYGSIYTPMQGYPWGNATRIGNQLYLHVNTWPTNCEIKIEKLPIKISSATLLNGQNLAYHQENDTLIIKLPQKATDPDVSVLCVEIDSSDKFWTDYSPEIRTTTAPKKYLQKQAITSGIINLILNGVIAFFMFRNRVIIPNDEIAVDILISVTIITYLVSRITVNSTRNEMIKGNVSRPKKSQSMIKLPKGGVLRSLVITILCVIVFGGVLDAAVYLFAAEGVNGWMYILVKTLYAGGAAALAAAVAVQSVINDTNYT